MDINNITPEIAKEINEYVSKIMSEIEYHIRYNGYNKGDLKRNFYDRLNEVDLWDTESIAEEYTRIKSKTSTLPRAMRDAVSCIFEAGIAKYITNHKNEENEVQ